MLLALFVAVSKTWSSSGVDLIGIWLTRGPTSDGNRGSETDAAGSSHGTATEGGTINYYRCDGTTVLAESTAASSNDGITITKASFKDQGMPALLMRTLSALTTKKFCVCIPASKESIS